MNVRMGDHSRILGVTPRNVTALVDAIEREGLIVRRPDATDRYAILLKLSEDGHALMDDLSDVQHTIAEKMFAPLNAAERRQLYDLLQRLASAAQSARATAENGSPREAHGHWLPHYDAETGQAEQTPRERRRAEQWARKERSIATRRTRRADANARGLFARRDASQRPGGD